MGRARSPYGGGGYRGTGLKVGRSSRRKRRSAWRTYVWTPLVTLILLGAAALAVTVIVDYMHQPGTQQAAPALAHAHSQGGGPTQSVTRTGAGSKSQSGGASDAKAGGAPAARPGAAGKGNVKAKGGKSGKTGESGKTGKSGSGQGSRSTPAAPAGSSAVKLVHSTTGVAAYAAAKGPLTATVHVAWLSWVRVLADGKLAFLHEEPTGFSRTFQAKRTLDVYLGYPQGSTVTVNGTRLGPFAGKATLWVDVRTGR